MVETGLNGLHKLHTIKSQFIRHALLEKSGLVCYLAFVCKPMLLVFLVIHLKEWCRVDDLMRDILPA